MAIGEVVAAVEEDEDPNQPRRVGSPKQLAKSRPGVSRVCSVFQVALLASSPSASPPSLYALADVAVSLTALAIIGLRVQLLGC